MALVECIRCECFPVGPDFLKDFWVVTAFGSSIDKLRLQRCQLVDKLLTHSLTQSVALTASESCKQSRQKHHLLLVHCNAISILEILLHNRNIVGNGLASLLSGNEVGDISHWPRTIQGIHGYKILESAGLQLLEVFLHTW